MRPFGIGVILALLLSASSNVREHRVTSHVMFRMTKNHTLVPMLPVFLEIDQESGPIMEGIISCDIIAREHFISADGQNAIGTETVLRCGDGVFTVKKML